MNYFLGLFLITFVALSYIWGKRDILSPWFILSTMFAMCFAFVLFNIDKWDVNYNFKTLIVIITGILSWWIGSLLSKPFAKLVKNAKTEKDVSISYKPSMVALISLCLMVIYMLLSVKLADGIDGSSFFRTIYENYSKGGSIGIIGNQILIISEVLAYISVFVILKNLKQNNKVTLFIPIICYAVIMLFSTDRNTFIRFVIYCICLWIIFFREKNKKYGNSKIVFRILICVVLFSIVFFLLGKAKSYTAGYFDSISSYLGSGLYALNFYVKDFSGEELTNGSATFRTLASVLTKIGFDIEVAPQFGKFINYVSNTGEVLSTNVYTAFQRYINDFGLMGCFIIPLCIGFFYEVFYENVKRKKGIWCVYYAMLIYPIIYYPITEQFFLRMHLGTAYEMIWMNILYKLLIKEKRKEQN